MNTTTLTKKSFSIAVAILFAGILQIQAQLGACGGSTGETPIFKEDFGEAPSTAAEFVTSSYINTTDYTYQNGAIPDNMYHVTNLSNGWTSEPLFDPVNCPPFCAAYDWFREGDYSSNHDSDPTNDGKGRMLLVNASAIQGEFFRLPVTNLCENTTYEFSARHANITPFDSALHCFDAWGCPKPINLKFDILDASTFSVIKSGVTGPIHDVLDSNGPGGINTMDWIQSAITFTTPPGVTSVVLVITNNDTSTNGYGNDLAIDDIVLRTCSTFPLTIADTSNNTTNTICATGTPRDLVITNPLAANQWQFAVDIDSDDTLDSAWTNIPGANTTTYSPPLSLLALFYPEILTTGGDVHIRVVSAGSLANLNNISCSVISNTYVLTVSPVPASPVVTTSCSLGIGMITITSPLGANIEYSLDGILYQTSSTFSGLANNTYAITARDIVSGCISVSTLVNINCGCVNQPTITLSSSSGAICGTSPITVSGNTFGGSATSVALSYNGTGNLSTSTSSTSPFSFTYTPTPADAGNVVTITVTTNNPLGVPCTAVSETYNLLVSTVPNAGTSGALTFCQGDIITNADLFASLGGSPDAGGSWSPVLAGAGVYTYTVPSNGLCPSEAATVTVTENTNCTINDEIISITAPDVLIPGETVQVVVNYSATQQRDIQTFLQSTVNWSWILEDTRTVNSGIGSFTINFTVPDLPNSIDLHQWGTYITTVNGGFENIIGGEKFVFNVDIDASSCPSLITPTFGAVSSVCESDAGMILSMLPTSSNNSTPITGTWILTADNGTSRDYTFTPDAGQCATATTLTIIINPTPNAGINASIDICNENIVSAAELFAALGSAANIGGTWSPIISGAGNYTYSINNGSCTDTAQVNVAFNGNVNCVPGVDVIIKIDAPNVIVPGQTVTVTIYYSATTTRQIQFFLENVLNLKESAKSSANANWVLEDLKTVEAGRGSYTITFTVPNLATSVDAYRWGAYMTTVGGGIDGMIGNMFLIEGVDVDESLSINQPELKNTFLIYPNPAQTELTINVSEAGRIDIMDLNGKVLMDTQINTAGNTILNIEALNSGVYFCRYTTANGAKTMKLVKM